MCPSCAHADRDIATKNKANPKAPMRPLPARPVDRGERRFACESDGGKRSAPAAEKADRGTWGRGSPRGGRGRIDRSPNWRMTAGLFLDQLDIGAWNEHRLSRG